jgi:hypothetical protein
MAIKGEADGGKKTTQACAYDDDAEILAPSRGFGF